MNPASDAGWLGVAVYAGGSGVTIAALLLAAGLMNLIHLRIQPARPLER
jgi:hypothetical protein